MADEQANVEIPEEEKVDGEEEEAGPVIPEHDPFAFKVVTLAQQQQALNGLRHNDHLRYRQYCTRRLRRLYVVLGHKHGNRTGRYKANPLPENFSDMRYLEIALVQAERAWSFGVQLKADSAAAAAPNPQWHHHAVARFAKAVSWAHKLEAMCKLHGDQRSQLEAEAYTSFLEGMHLLEKEAWAEALAKLKLCRRVCDRLGLASEDADKALFKAKAQELDPMLRLCKYNLGQAYDADDGDDFAKVAAGAKKELSELSYRGHGLSIPSEKIKVKLLACLELVSAIQVGPDDHDNTKIEKYGELAAEFGDTLKDIHADMINAGSDEAQVAEWHMLEAYARELSISMNVERNLLLLWNQLLKLDGLEEIGSPEARKQCRPEEGVRFCDLLKEDVGNLRELPETNDQFAATLTAYNFIVVNARCFFLALCYSSVGKTLEAAALMDMLHMRMPDMEGGAELEGPLGRIHARFEQVFEGLPTRVAQWRCRGLANLCKTKSKATDKGDEQVSNKAPAEDFTSLASFPPRFRDIPCKPLLFDLAFPLIVQPDLEDTIAQRKQDEDKKGLLRSVAGGIGSRLSGLWGKK